MLQIKDLNVTINDKKIINNFNMVIKEGEIHALMGPNGTGKSTLSRVIMGDDTYQVNGGKILFNEIDITSLQVVERAHLGIFLTMQNPIAIEGVSNSEFLKTALTEKNKDRVPLYDFIVKMEHAALDLGINEDMLHRAVNEGFSGGERKKNEILQIKILKPKLIILDEIDSGLDIDSLKVVTDNLNKYLKENPQTMILIITHYPRILGYLKPTHVHMMVNGQIIKTGDYSLASQIEKTGYNGLNRVSGEKGNE